MLLILLPFIIFPFLGEQTTQWHTSPTTILHFPSLLPLPEGIWQLLAALIQDAKKPRHVHIFSAQPNQLHSTTLQLLNKN
jgi:hypothetical protein